MRKKFQGRWRGAKGSMAKASRGCKRNIGEVGEGKTGRWMLERLSD